MKTRLFKPENRLLIVLQFYKGDQNHAMQLARFIADIQPGRCENADFLFVSRFDCPQDHQTVRYVSKKFNTWTYTSKRRGVGWPHGPNELWFGSMEWVYHMIEARKIPAYKAVFTFEADGVPLAPNWINVFLNSWNEQEAKAPLFVFGAYLLAPGPHINGNAMFSGNPAFLHWVAKKVGGAPPRAGWDYALYADFKRWGAADFPKLKSYWGTKTFSEEGFKQALSQEIVYIHGVKDMSLLKMARKYFLG